MGGILHSLSRVVREVLSENRFSVSAPRTTRAIFSRLTLCFFGLAFCVFTWGLQYKISLYDLPQAVSREMPKAKLLSKNEQRAVSESPLLSDSRVPRKVVRAVLVSVFLPLLVAFHLLLLFRQVRKGPDTEGSERACVRASLTAFFFRPPPILA